MSQTARKVDEPASLGATGAFSAEGIQSLIKERAIMADTKTVQPASFDVTLSGEIYRVRALALPRTGESVRAMLKLLKGTPHHIASPLERNVPYLARLNERVRLPKGIYGYANPKSSTGRNGVHARLITDGSPRYDAIEDGFDGELWLSIVPRTYPVLVAPELALAQIRIFSEDTRLSEDDLKREISQGFVYSRRGEKLGYDDMRITDHDGSVMLTIDMESPIVGWECLFPGEVLDMTKIGVHDPHTFFRPIHARGGEFEAKLNGFYILSTNERVRIPPEYAGEMRPMDDRSGEFRVHAAGFFDPGWGCDKDGDGTGRTGTLEVWTYEPRIFLPGTPVAKFRYERMMEAPLVHYDAGSPNYGVQEGPKLAKQFRAP